MRIIIRQVIFLLLISSVFAVPVEAQRLKDTVKLIDAIFADINKEMPGAAVRITRGDKVLYSKGFGMGDLEHGISINDETIFEAGSVSKQFAATAVLLLADAGKLRLNDDVRKYIPELPDYGDMITVRHLMHHTSGLRDWGSVIALSGWPRGSRVYTNELALSYIVRQEGLNYRPGEEYLYSNSNYTLLTIIAERVSGQSLAEFTKKNIFEPLGMKNTGWRTNFKEVVKDRAIGYDRIKGQFYSNMPFENTYGHAALLTTVKDLDIWNKSWKKTPLGSDSLLIWREQTGILNNGEQISYAGGVMIGKHNGVFEVSHSGATAGYRAWMAYYPQKDLSIVYLSNATFVPTVSTGKKVADVFFGAETKSEPGSKKSKTPDYTADAEDLKRLEGKYYSAECEGTYRFFVKDNKLWVHDGVGEPRSLKAISRNHFEGRGATFSFRQYGTTGQVLVSVPRARNVKFVEL